MLIIPPDLAQALAVKLAPALRPGPGGCILSSMHVNSVSGYSYVRGRGADMVEHHYLAHRVMYTALVGPIPEGLTIDHRCEVRNCVNVAHLRAVTIGANVLRSSTNPTAINARKTACPAGHPYEAHQTGRGRSCTTCRAARYAARIRAGLDAEDRRHGTLNGYTNWGCRCEACKTAWRNAYAARRGRL